MSIIGTFKTDGEAYRGDIQTIVISLNDVRIEPVEKAQDKSPNYRVRMGKSEIGAAWKKTSKQGRPYLSVMLDDPALVSTVYCRLIETDANVLALLWERSRAK